MRLLRMLTNSLLAGGLGAAYLTVLLLQLNPDLPLLSLTAVRWFLALALTYGVLAALVFYAFLVVRDFFSLTALYPGWASVRVLAWLSASSAAAAAVLMWLNAGAFRTALGELAARRMIAGAVALGLSAVVLAGIAVVHYSYGRRGGRVGGALFAIAAIGSLILPVAARGPAVTRGGPVPLEPGRFAGAEPGSAPRVLMLLFDAASLEYIRTKAAEGRLPNFSRVLEGGASLYLSTLRPTHPTPVWTAVATGMYPPKNGVRSAGRYQAWGAGHRVTLLPAYCLSHALVRLGLVREEPHTSGAWHARPLWSILSNAGVPSGIVRWPLTYPAGPVLGFTVSDRDDLFSAAQPPSGRHAVYPPEILADVRAVLEEDGDGGGDGTAVARSAARDRRYARAARSLIARHRPRVAALRFRAIDTAVHWHYEGAESGTFRGNGAGRGRANAQEIERAYADADAQVGEALGSLVPGDLLLVVSGFGMERLNPAKGLLARLLGDPVLPGGHDRAPDGFLLAYGRSIQPGRLPPGSIVDVTPTVLYFAGVPIGRDMDGFARTDLFTAEFTAERPIAFIGSHNP